MCLSSSREPPAALGKPQQPTTTQHALQSSHYPSTLFNSLQKVVEGRGGLLMAAEGC